MTDTSAGKRDFFVSFTGADRPWARWLAKVLSGAGYSYWFQDQDFHGSIPRSIEAAHACSERTILILSDAYARSGYCRSEWEMRYQQDPGGAKDLLILFRIDPCDPPPLLSRHDQRDLFTCSDEAAAEEEVRQRLLQAVAPGHRRALGEAAFPGGRTVDAPFPVPAHNLPRPSRLFVGRATELTTLAAALANSGRSVITQPQAVTGLGGVGKTQLTLHYAYAHLADYDLIFWLRAEEPSVLAADYVGLAPALELDPAARDRATLVAAVRGRLERRDRWLLVFDNAGEPDALDPYLPRTGGGHVLVTSRWREWEGAAAALELEVLPEAEAVALLLGEGAGDAAERAAAAELAEVLGRLPLALAQARAFMRARKVGVASYRQQLAAARSKVLAWRPPNAGYPLAVAQAWQASLDQAARDCPAAGELMSLLAFLAPEDIPRDLLGAEPDALPEGLRDAFERDGAIEALGRFSLVRLEPDSLTVHRLVQAVTRDGLDEPMSGRYALAAVALVDAALPRPAWDNAHWPAIRRLLPQALAAAEAAERLGVGLAGVGTILTDLGEYLMESAASAAAEPLLRRAVAARERALGPDHPDLATSLNKLANACDKIGRTAEGDALMERAVAICERALGPEHLRSVEMLGCLSLSYLYAGRRAEAEPLVERALAAYARILGPDLPDHALSLNEVARLYDWSGRRAEAEPFYHRAIAAAEQALGPEHPRVAGYLLELASLFDRMDRLAEAEPLLERAVAIEERAFGVEHPKLANPLRRLAGLYEQTGRRAKAEALHRRALAITERVLGPEHPDFADSLFGLANGYVDTNRFAEAEPLLLHCLEIFEKVFGPEHPRAGALYQLAVVYIRTGRSAKAEPLLHRALAVQERLLGSEHRFVGGSLYRLAQVYLDTDRATEAEPLLLRTLGIHERAYGPEHLYVSGPLSALGCHYVDSGRFTEAEPLLRRCIEIIEKARQPDHPHLVSVLESYAVLLDQVGRNEEAAALRKQVEAPTAGSLKPARLDDPLEESPRPL